jgi:hypothetical protein
MLTKTILRDQKTNVSHTHSILTCAQTISRRYLVRIVWHLCELETKNYITHCALAAIQLRNIMHNIQIAVCVKVIIHFQSATQLLLQQLRELPSEHKNKLV